MRRTPSLVALLGLLLALTGCHTRSSFFTARLQDCSPAHIPARHTFEAEDIPAIVYLHYSDQTVTVRIYDLATGQMVWTKTDRVPRYHTCRWWNLSALPNGSYKAELLTGGNVRQTCNFKVARKPASPAA